jgi:hypothetical protein
VIRTAFAIGGSLTPWRLAILEATGLPAYHVEVLTSLGWFSAREPVGYGFLPAEAIDANNKAEWITVDSDLEERATALGWALAMTALTKTGKAPYSWKNAAASAYEMAVCDEAKPFCSFAVANFLVRCGACTTLIAPVPYPTMLLHKALAYVGKPAIVTATEVDQVALVSARRRLDEMAAQYEGVA